MTDVVRELFVEFRSDHEILGRGLHDIATALRASDDDRAADAARKLDRAAGAHIAFEEKHFYPELRELLSDGEVDALEQEHKSGQAAIGKLATLRPSDSLTDTERAVLVEQIETMQVHTAECGELFGALGRIARKRQEKLLTALRQLRKASPAWTALAEAGPTQ